MSPELLGFIGNGFIGGVFAWLFVDLKKRYEDMQARYEAARLEQQRKHEAEIARLYDLRIFEIKMLAKLPTDLEGYKMGPDSPVPA